MIDVLLSSILTASSGCSIVFKYFLITSLKLNICLFV